MFRFFDPDCPTGFGHGFRRFTADRGFHHLREDLQFEFRRVQAFCRANAGQLAKLQGANCQEDTGFDAVCFESPGGKTAWRRKSPKAQNTRGNALAIHVSAQRQIFNCVCSDFSESVMDHSDRLPPVGSGSTPAGCRGFFRE